MENEIGTCFNIGCRLILSLNCFQYCLLALIWEDNKCHRPSGNSHDYPVADMYGLLRNYQQTDDNAL